MGSYWIDAKWLKQSIWNTIKNATTDQCTSISYKTQCKLQDFCYCSYCWLLLILLGFFQTVHNHTMKKTQQKATKQGQKPISVGSTKQEKNMYVFMWPFISPMTSKKYHIYKRYEMKWPIVLQIYIVWPLPPSFFTSLLMSSSQWVHLTCPEASVLLNVPPGYFSFAFNYKDTAATKLLPQQATTHTHKHTHISVSCWLI